MSDDRKALHEAARRIATTAEEAVDCGLPGWQSVQDDAETILAALASGDLVPRKDVEAPVEAVEHVSELISARLNYEEVRGDSTFLTITRLDAIHLKATLDFALAALRRITCPTCHGEGSVTK